MYCSYLEILHFSYRLCIFLQIMHEILFVKSEISKLQWRYYIYWTVRHCDSWRIRDQLDVTSYYILFHFFYAQHVSNINTSIIGDCEFSIVSPHWLYVLVSMCVGVLVWLGWGGIRVAGFRIQPATRIPPQPSHTEIPTHIETRTYVQCCDTIEKSQAPDNGCINVRIMLSIEEVK